MKRSIFQTLSLTKMTSSSFSGLLRQRLQDIVPTKQAQLNEIKKKHGTQVIGNYTVAQALGGMRGIKGIFYDGSLLDPQSGITIRDFSIPEIQEYLPKAEGGNEPLPEALFWLLMTGEFPSQHEFEDVRQEWKDRGNLDKGVLEFIQRLPKESHPMTMLSQSVLFLQKNSTFAKDYYVGKATKSHYWEYFYEDSIDLIAKLPRMAALIYRHKYYNDKFIESNNSLDWAGNYAHMLGYPSHEVKECIRGYLSIHSDHEGGNVSAHACHLVGSALADPYLSYSSAINGLAGPLHGLANQEVLKWLLEMKETLGDKITPEQIKEYVMQTLASGKVVPGYGHAVLRHTDPRFLHQKAFAEKYIKNDPLVDLVAQCYHAIPGVLKTIAKIQNPWPNVDAHSGVLLYHFGLREFDYYTCVFAVSRSLGCLSNLVWSRAFGLPIERPGSMTMKWIDNKFGNKAVPPPQ